MLEVKRTQQDIFSSLSKYCSGQGEHYAVEAFTFVLNLLLDTDRDAAVSILNRLTSTNESIFDSTDDIEVLPQQPAGEAGIPDITIRCANKLIFVEIKVESPVDLNQLQKYNHFLESSGVNLNKLVVLTKYYPDLSKELRKQVKQVRWDDVRKWLLEAEAKVGNVASRFILNSFVNYLKEEEISMNKVTSDYLMLKYSIPQLGNLVGILDSVSKELGDTNVTIAKPPNGYVGFYNSTGKLWLGVTFRHPLDLTFELSPVKDYDLPSLEATLLERLPSEAQKYNKDGSGEYIYFRWNLEECGFFSLDLDRQTGMVKEIHRVTWDVARESKRTSAA